MDLIVCVDRNWGIGKNNELLFHVPADMAFFKKMTMGKTIIMGRKTLESFKDSKPLPKRMNVVLTRDTSKISKFENLKFITEKEITNYQDGILIGGGSLYSAFLNECEYAYVTKIDSEKEADTYFPNLDRLENWEQVEEIERGESGGYVYKILKYHNNKKQKQE